jgi:thiamine-phosphate pyrophosphorylase
MLRYAITGAAYKPGDAVRWAAEGVEYVQLRDKTLDAAHLKSVADAILDDIRRVANAKTKLLINGRADVAIAAGADGVHLTAHQDELRPEQVRRIFALAGAAPPIVSVSCHSVDEAVRGRDGGADLVLFAPVFEKVVEGTSVVEGAGLELLREVCAAVVPLPVLALGGVTSANAGLCVAAGAAGVAGIRMFAGPAHSLSDSSRTVSADL